MIAEAKKVWTTEEMRKLLTESDKAEKACVRGMLKIYDFQTAEEQSMEATVEDNGVGFNGADAEILSSFSEQVREWMRTPADMRRFDSPLSQKQMAIVLKKMPKYAGQLARIANGEQ